MVGKFFQEFFMFLINGERGCHLELFMRECFEMNGSPQNCSKASCKWEAYPYPSGTVPYRTVPKSRVNAANKCTLIKTQKDLQNTKAIKKDGYNKYK